MAEVVVPWSFLSCIQREADIEKACCRTQFTDTLFSLKC